MKVREKTDKVIQEKLESLGLIVPRLYDENVKAKNGISIFAKTFNKSGSLL